MPDDTPTRDRIIAATIEAAAVHGIARLGVADVARRAGVSRQTVYAHFPSKDALLAGAVLDEANRLLTQVLDAIAPHDDPRTALEVGIAAVLRLTREHPLLDRLVRTEPETLLPLLTAEGGPGLIAARQAVEGVVRRKLPHLAPVAQRRFADVVSRLLVSYAITAPDDPPELVAACLSAWLIEGVQAVPHPAGPP